MGTKSWIFQSSSFPVAKFPASAFLVVHMCSTSWNCRIFTHTKFSGSEDIRLKTDTRLLASLSRTLFFVHENNDITEIRYSLISLRSGVISYTLKNIYSLFEIRAWHLVIRYDTKAKLRLKVKMCETIRLEHKNVTAWKTSEKMN